MNCLVAIPLSIIALASAPAWRGIVAEAQSGPAADRCAGVASLRDTVPLYVVARGAPTTNIASGRLVAYVLQDVLEHLSPLPSHVALDSGFLPRPEFGAIQFTLKEGGRTDSLRIVDDLRYLQMEHRLLGATLSNVRARSMPLITNDVGAESLLIQIGFRLDTTGVLVHAHVGHAVVTPRDWTPVYVKRRIEPTFPGVGGEIIVKFVVDQFGRVEPATFQVVRTDHPDLVHGVRRAVRRWEFHPASIRGCPVKQWVQLPVTFAWQ